MSLTPKWDGDPPLSIFCFVLLTLTYVGLKNTIKLVIIIILTWHLLAFVDYCSVVMFSVFETFCFPFSLTPSFSRLFQTFSGAVWKAVHHAQEHAEALREHRQLLRIRPPLSQCGGFLRRAGQLPLPLHGEFETMVHLFHLQTHRA